MFYILLLTFPIFFILSILVFFLCCCYPSLFLLFHLFKNKKSPNSSFFEKKCLGHRGAKKDEFPFSENTMSAFRYSFDSGSDGIEFDVNYTRDHKLAIFHDIQSTERVMSRIDKTHKGTPKIRNLSMSQLRSEFEYTKGKGDVVPDLEDVISLVKEKNKVRNFSAMIELKEWRLFESILMAFQISDLFMKYPFLYDHSVVGSFNPFILYVLRWINPKIVVNMLYYRNIFSYYSKHYDRPDIALYTLQEQYLATKTSPSIFSLLLPAVFVLLDTVYEISFFSFLPGFIGTGVIGMSLKESNNEGTIKRWLKRGFGVNIWGVEKLEDKKRLLEMGVSVTTDSTFD